ncbi:hypothetical protein COV93_05355 [Candidatus Woesearchaeota archaeon CG11_big_fil_rev_8_21_14_0_20_43_8]|nr:MAG: hypothetical protein COV93_05355 [Candidatus Woesearchaeota archaeon CG11_big_fil_rev_8_21_14_0_20_43_8]PIO07059.1 MAG: hypothetical protein COT47_01625 [Candidatus Woesearchaeota archaeon CG08_land_8_20_14_0_20_43_7]
MTYHKKRSRIQAKLRLAWLYLKGFCIEQKHYIAVITLFCLFYGIFFIQFNDDGDDGKMPILYVESIDICEGFDTQRYEATGCNNVFDKDIGHVTVFYYVSFNSTPTDSLYIRWYDGDTLLQETDNDFKQKGKPVDPGEYLLATQSDFTLESGDYRVELYEGRQFLAYSNFKVLP